MDESIPVVVRMRDVVCGEKMSGGGGGGELMR